MTTSSMPEAHAQQRRHQRPQRAGQRAARDHERAAPAIGGQAADHLAHAGRRDRAQQQLALGADVPVAGPEGDGHRRAGEEDRRGG